MQGHPKILTAVAAIALCATAFLAACTVVVEDPNRPLPPRPGPAFCSREFAPVCAQRFDQRRTFANACVAQREGFRVVSSGECRQRPQFCTREFAPVCATRRGALRTFPNACEARAADWRIIGNGRC